MMQGDAFVQKIKILNNGQIVTPEDVLDVEVTFGRLSKTLWTGICCTGMGCGSFRFRRRRPSVCATHTRACRYVSVGRTVT